MSDRRCRGAKRLAVRRVYPGTGAATVYEDCPGCTDCAPDAPPPPTFWNGIRTPARRVTVTVADAPATARYWARHLVGTDRPAVEVTVSPDEVRYLDDGPSVTKVPKVLRERVGASSIRFRAGSAWAKVTEGKGSPRFGHREIEVENVRPREGSKG